MIATKMTSSHNDNDVSHVHNDNDVIMPLLMHDHLQFGLRGLEEDILKRVAGDISGKCNCSFSTSALKGGFFSFGESVTYHSQVLGVSGQTALGLVGILKESIGKDPLIQHRSDIYLAATMVF